MLNRGVHPVIPSQGSVGASGDLAPLVPSRTSAHRRRRSLFPRQANARSRSLTARRHQAACARSQRNHFADQRHPGHARRRTACDPAGVRSWPTPPTCLEPSPSTPSRAPTSRLTNASTRLGRIPANCWWRATFAACSKAARSASPIAAAARCRTPTRCAAFRRCTAPCATRWPIAAQVFEIEMNSAVDNPLVFPAARKSAARKRSMTPAVEGDIISGGNFHGEPLAFALDFLAIALSALAGISERRLERLVNPALNEELPPFLAPGAGLNSGFMMPQVTAAALVSENKVLSHPASVDSITTSGNKEDFVSMGMTCRQQAAARDRQHAQRAGHRSTGRGAGTRLPRATQNRQARPGRTRGHSRGVSLNYRGSHSDRGFPPGGRTDCQRQTGATASLASAGLLSVVP